MMVEMRPGKKDQDEIWAEQLIEDDHDEEDEDNEDDLLEKLTNRLRHNTFIVGG